MRLGDVADDAVGLRGVAGPVHGAAGALHRRLELLQVVIEVAQDALLERPSGLAQRLPVGQLGHDGGALGANRVGGVTDVVAQLAVGQRLLRRLGKRPGAHRAASVSVLARISAR